MGSKSIKSIHGSLAAASNVFPGRATLTLAEIEGDDLTQLANARWSTKAMASKERPKFDPKIVVDIYNKELGGSSDEPGSLKRLMLLEVKIAFLAAAPFLPPSPPPFSPAGERTDLSAQVSQYLENYLWPNFDGSKASPEHVLSIMALVNEKFRQTVPAWRGLQSREDAFAGFFQRVVSVPKERPLKLHERGMYTLFLTNCFQSLEHEMVRTQALKLVSLPMWHALSPGRLQLELHQNEQLAKHWK